MIYSSIKVSLNGRMISNNFRRIRRFFSGFALDFEVIATVLTLINPVEGPYKLCLDHTC